MKPFYLILFVLPHLISSEIVNLTDETWKIMLNGQWMVELWGNGKQPEKLELLLSNFSCLSATHLGVRLVNIFNQFGKNSLIQCKEKISMSQRSISVNIHRFQVVSRSLICRQSISEKQNPFIMNRFQIQIVSCSSVRNGFFRQFTGERSLTGLKNYIENELWKATDPVSTYIAPNSLS